MNFSIPLPIPLTSCHSGLLSHAGLLADAGADARAGTGWIWPGSRRDVVFDVYHGRGVSPGLGRGKCQLFISADTSEVLRGYPKARL